MAVVCAVLATAWICAAAEIHAADRHGNKFQQVMPGEFEKTESVLLGWEQEDADIQHLQLQMIGAISKQTKVLLLVRTVGEHQAVLKTAQKLAIPLDAVTIRKIPFNSIWARDYGPLFVRKPLPLSVSKGNAGKAPLGPPPKRFVVVDTEYPDVERPDDDAIPDVLGRMCGFPVHTIPVSLQGGNLLSNGAGLYLTTRKTLTENALFDRKNADVIRGLKSALGASELIFLEELIGEPNGHVDMFATFVSATTVVVGEYQAKDDAVNAAILDRNAARLARVRTPFGPLKVVRIPMPKRKLDIWPTYTNVLRANGVMLMPVYPGVDPAAEAKARAVYKKLLPKIKIVEIDCMNVIDTGGALHCMTMNLPVAPPSVRIAVPPPRPVRRMLVIGGPQKPLAGQPVPRADTHGFDTWGSADPFLAAFDRFTVSMHRRIDAYAGAVSDVRAAEFVVGCRRKLNAVRGSVRDGVQAGLRVHREKQRVGEFDRAARPARGADPVEALRVFGDEFEFDASATNPPAAIDVIPPTSSRRRFCDRIVRRDFLKVGVLGGALGLPELLRLQAQSAEKERPAKKAVIMVCLNGGPSHVDMYDLKPEAPVEIRGEFQPIRTNVSGFDLCELMPRQAGIADKLALVRSVQWPIDDGHRLHLVFTGFRASDRRPSFGSVVSRLRGDHRSPLPPYVSMAQFPPHPILKGHEEPSYVGTPHRPFVPYQAGPLVGGTITYTGPGAGEVKNLDLVEGVTPARLNDRKALLGAFDTLRRDIDASGELAGKDAFTARALEMVSSEEVRDAFDLSREPESLRARYGGDIQCKNDPDRRRCWEGSKFLLARRLVEAGVPVVTLSVGVWDTHSAHFTYQRDYVPRLDQHVLDDRRRIEELI
eukprot:g8467.t1